MGSSRFDKASKLFIYGFNHPAPASTKKNCWELTPSEGWKCYFRDPIVQNLPGEHAFPQIHLAAPSPNKSNLATALFRKQRAHWIQPNKMNLNLWYNHVTLASDTFFDSSHFTITVKFCFSEISFYSLILFQGFRWNGIKNMARSMGKLISGISILHAASLHTVVFSHL